MSASVDHKMLLYLEARKKRMWTDEKKNQIIYDREKMLLPVYIEYTCSYSQRSVRKQLMKTNMPLFLLWLRQGLKEIIGYFSSVY